MDNKGHTVLGLLAEYTADKAREIQTMIEGEGVRGRVRDLVAEVRARGDLVGGAI